MIVCMSVWFSLSLSLWNLFFFFESPSFLLVFSFWNMNFFVDFLFVKTLNSVWNDQNNLKNLSFWEVSTYLLYLFFWVFIFKISVEFVRLLLLSNYFKKCGFAFLLVFFVFLFQVFCSLILNWLLLIICKKAAAFLSVNPPQISVKNAIATP